MRFGEKNYKYFTGYFCDDYKMKQNEKNMRTKIKSDGDEATDFHD